MSLDGWPWLVLVIIGQVIGWAELRIDVRRQVQFAEQHIRKKP